MATIGEGLASFGRNFAAGQAAQATARQNRLLQEQQLDYKKQTLALQEKEINMRQAARDDIQAEKDAKILEKQEEAVKFNSLMNQLSQKTGASATSRLVERMGVTPEEITVSGAGVERTGAAEDFSGLMGPTEAQQLDADMAPNLQTFATDLGIPESTPAEAQLGLDQFSGGITQPEGIGEVEVKTTPGEKKMNLVERFGAGGALAQLEDLGDLPPALQLKVQERALNMEAETGAEAQLKAQKAMVDFDNALLERDKKLFEAEDADLKRRGLDPETMKRSIAIFGDQTVGDITTKRDIISNAASAQDVMSHADTLLDITKQVSESPLDRVLSPVDYKAVQAKAKVAAGFLVGALRLPIVGPGALSEQELALLKDIAADPTELLRLSSSSKVALETMKEKVASKFKGMVESNGLDFNNRGDNKFLSFMDPFLKKSVGQPTEFSTAEEAASAGLKSGDKFILNGVLQQVN